MTPSRSSGSPAIFKAAQSRMDDGNGEMDAWSAKQANAELTVESVVGQRGAESSFAQT